MLAFRCKVVNGGLLFGSGSDMQCHPTGTPPFCESCSCPAAGTVCKIGAFADAGKPGERFSCQRIREEMNMGIEVFHKTGILLLRKFSIE